MTITAEDTTIPTVQNISSKDFSKFSHGVPEHAEINCDACHMRGGDKVTDLNYSGHESCVRCHLNEFINPKSGMCVICHDNLQEAPPTMNVFPVEFSEGFNMKFDHAAHSRGAGRPQAGCEACHLPQGSAKSIPVSINAHANCYTCHTPESNIGSCSVCHELAPYRRTRVVRTIFKAVFSHTDHSFRQGVSCDECHSVRANMPQAQQVSTPVAIQHFSAGNAVSCRTCHNDSRAFGDLNFANCKRCHGSSGFDMLPN